MENKEQENKRFLNIVLKKICKKSEHTFWEKDFCNQTDIQTFANNIVNEIQKEFEYRVIFDKKINDKEDKKRFFRNWNDTSKNKNIRNYVTFVENEPKRREEALERIITMLNPDFENQKTTPDRGHIDIVTNIKDGIVTFIELKMNNKTGEADTPLYALIESLKNKHLIENLEKTTCKRLQKAYKNKIEKVEKLIILAPYDYYKNYYKNTPKSVGKLYELKNRFNVEIEFKYIDISLTEWNNLIKFISENCSSVEEEIKKDRLHRKIIFKDDSTNEKDIKKYIEDKNLKDKFTKWKDLTSAKDWDFN